MNRRDEVFAFTKQLLLGFLDADESSITPDARFADLGVDSLDLVEVQVSFDRAYGVRLQSSVFASGEVKTVGDLVDYAIRLADERTPAARAGVGA